MTSFAQSLLASSLITPRRLLQSVFLLCRARFSSSLSESEFRLRTCAEVKGFTSSCCANVPLRLERPKTDNSKYETAFVQLHYIQWNINIKRVAKYFCVISPEKMCLKSIYRNRELKEHIEVFSCTKKIMP